MPIQAFLPLIQAGIQAAAGAGQGLMQGGMNRKTMDFNKWMYDRQRKDALADWSMQNEYNSPAAQMQRFKDAGLSPHLIYGQTNQAGAVRSTESKPWNPSAADISTPVARSIEAYNVGRVTNQQLSQMASQEDLNRANIRKAEAGVLESNQRVIESLSRTKGIDLKNQWVDKLSQSQVDVMNANLALTEARTSGQLTDNELKIATQSDSIQSAMLKVLQQRADLANSKEEKNRILAQIENIKADTSLKNSDLDLRAKGIYPGDSAWLRLLVKGLNEAGIDPGKKIGEMIKGIISWFEPEGSNRGAKKGFKGKPFGQLGSRK